MRSVQNFTKLVLLLAFTTAAAAQVNFTPPTSSPTHFTPVVFNRPQWTPTTSVTQPQPVQPFSVVQVQPLRFQQVESTTQQQQFRNDGFVVPVLSGTRRTNHAPAAAKVTPVQSARAARTSLNRFSQGLDSLK